MCWTLVCDGGSKGNPGLGYGSYRLRPPGGEWGAPMRLEFGDGVTNNQAEYRALIAGLEGLAETCEPAECSIIVHSDSELVMKQLTGENKVRKARLVPYFIEAKEASKRFRRVDFEWWPRKRSVELLGH